MVVWVGIHKRRENVIGGSGWKRQRLHVAGYSGKPLPSIPRKNVCMETTFGCKTTTFAQIWLVQ